MKRSTLLSLPPQHVKPALFASLALLMATAKKEKEALKDQR
jgi:hypothetical protein